VKGGRKRRRGVGRDEKERRRSVIGEETDLWEEEAGRGGLGSRILDRKKGRRQTESQETEINEPEEQERRAGGRRSINNKTDDAQR
jgi:hypothetical protein